MCACELFDFRHSVCLEVECRLLVGGRGGTAVNKEMKQGCHFIVVTV